MSWTSIFNIRLLYLSWFEYSIKLVPLLAAGSHILSSLSLQYITLSILPLLMVHLLNQKRERCIGGQHKNGLFQTGQQL